MCGIVFKASFDGKEVNKDILEQYEKQKSRGMRGFGFYDVTNDKIYKTPKERKAKKLLQNKRSKNILFHHRFPTSTENTTNACHPFSTRKHYMKKKDAVDIKPNESTYIGKKYILVHNGHINNSRDLRKAHEASGIKYESIQHDDKFNDSEALLWDFAEILEGKQVDFKARGNVAFICLEIDIDGKNKKLYFGSNGNPLNMVITKDKELSLSSEGDGDPIKEHTLYCFNYQTQELTEKAMRIASYPVTATTPYKGSEFNHMHYNRPEYNKGDSTTSWDSMTERERNRKVMNAVSAHYGIPVDTSNYPSLEDFLSDDEDGDEEYRGAKRPDITGSPYNFSADDLLRITRIKQRTAKYINIGGGYFQLAYDALQEDYDALDAYQSEIVYERGACDPDVAYEQEIHRSTMDMLLMNPQWTEEESMVHGWDEAHRKEVEARKVPLTERPAIAEAKEGVQMEFGGDTLEKIQNIRNGRTASDAGAIAVAEFNRKREEREKKAKEGMESMKDLLSKNELGRAVGRKLLTQGGEA